MRSKGFTLAEVLIALALLGVVAAFAIPKVLITQQNERNNALAKETIAALSEAYQQLYLNGKLVNDQTTNADLILQTLNVTTDTTAMVDVVVLLANGTQPVGNCGAAPRFCYRMPNGVLLTSDQPYVYHEEENYAMWFAVDVDGKTNGATSKPGDALGILILNNGRVVTLGQITQTLFRRMTDSNNNPAIPNTAIDPPWLKW